MMDGRLGPHAAPGLAQPWGGPDSTASAASQASAANVRPAGGYERYVKPILDRSAGVVLTLVALPLLVAVALAVRIKMGKGVIYKQRRVGRNGVPFTMYKFRTMAPDRRGAVRPYDGPDRRICHKRDDDPRHTRFGMLLRRSSLDELPQLWNVIRGDMSLVGPRPELPHIVERYEPWQHERHQVKPGITGVWQLSGRAGGMACEGVELDIAYLESLSFVTDMVILLRTVPVAISRTGR